MDFTPSAHRATAPPSRRRATARPVVGAVRRTALASPPRRARRARTLAAGLSLATAGVIAATIGTGSDDGSPLPLANASVGFPTPTDGADALAVEPTGTATAVARAPEPTFFFDDAADALAERAAARRAVRPAGDTPDTRPTARPAETTLALAAPPVDASAPSRAALGPTAADDASPPPAPAPPSRPHADAVPRGPGAPAKGAAVPSGVTEIEVAVAPGDTLSGILNDHGVRMEQMPRLLADEVVVNHLSRLEIGQRFTIARGPDGDFRSLAARIGKDTRVSVRRTGGGFETAAIDLPLERERVVTSGTIEQSLYLAAERAELKQSTIMTLADIFQWELDFARDIRKGDHFAIVYDRLYRDGRYVGDGDILAAEFERGGRTHRAIRFVTDDGVAGYYSPDGTSKRRTFTRHPVDVVRITSKFDPNRLHPVLHQIRAHRGVDYGAPHGSPIRATADGIVRVSGTRGAYGQTVVLQHGQRVETLYAHMSRISDKSIVGQRVRQGDVIGYVGNTGRVTGTHLHYEFRVNGEHVDPLTVELPAAAPIAPEHRDALRDLSDELVAQMRSVLPGTVTAVASNDVAPLDAGAEAAGVSLER